MTDSDLNLDVLIGTLKDTTEFNDLKKKIGRLEKGARPLATPAARTTEERAVRKVRPPGRRRRALSPLSFSTTDTVCVTLRDVRPLLRARRNTRTRARMWASGTPR